MITISILLVGDDDKTRNINDGDDNDDNTSPV